MNGTNEIAVKEIDFKFYGIDLPFIWTVGDTVAASSFFLSLQYNIENLKVGYAGAQDKKLAMYCMIPYF